MSKRFWNGNPETAPDYYEHVVSTVMVDANGAEIVLVRNQDGEVYARPVNEDDPRY